MGRYILPMAIKFTEFVFVQIRKCYKCNSEKDRSEFQKDSYDKYGLQAKCKTCTSLATQKFKKTNPTYFKEKGLERYHSVVDTKKFNKERYALYREAYLSRRRQYSESERGRLTTLLKSAQLRSKKNNKLFDLDINWLLNLYEMQNGCCLLTNIPFVFTTIPGKNRSYYPLSPSLDKINPNGDYVKSNVRLDSFGEDAFAKLAEAFLETRKNKSE